jgi:hypothetical protein
MPSYNWRVRIWDTVSLNNPHTNGVEWQQNLEFPKPYEEVIAI